MFSKIIASRKITDAIDSHDQRGKEESIAVARVLSVIILLLS
jgi:hypothetical protein